MATDAFVRLERLRCLKLQLTEARTEPYLWPVLIQIDDSTLATTEIVAVISPSVGNARVVIKDSMAVGESAAIPTTVGILRARLEDNLVTQRLLLVVALLEEDESPRAAVEAGFKAFRDELRAAVIANLLALRDAEGEQLQALIDLIKKRVTGRVKSAIENSLSGWQKTKVFAGILNLDDALGSDFVQFGKPALESKAFTLTFESTGSLLGAPTATKYQVDGQIQLKRVTVDRCQALVDAVNAALSTVRDIEAQIKGLQAELQNAPPAEKPFIISEIKRLREEELAAAEAALDAARRALTACRSRLPFRLPDVEVVQLEES